MLTLITLTHAADVDGRFSPLEDYRGRTALDPHRIESIEEVIHPTKGTVSYVTMQSGQAHTVSETIDQINQQIAELITPWSPMPTAVMAISNEKGQR